MPWGTMVGQITIAGGGGGGGQGDCDWPARESKTLRGAGSICKDVAHGWAKQLASVHPVQIFGTKACMLSEVIVQLRHYLKTWR
jgi:hypothetical protein